MSTQQQDPCLHPAPNQKGDEAGPRIVRSRYTHRFFVMSWDTAQDARLSFEARGVLTYLLSKPQNWQVSRADLMAEGHIGREKVDRILAELKAAGYVRIDRTQDARGRFTGTIYYVFDTPQPDDGLDLSGNDLERPSHILDQSEGELGQPDQGPSPAMTGENRVTVKPCYGKTAPTRIEKEHTIDTPVAPAGATEGGEQQQKKRPRNEHMDVLAECLYGIERGAPLGREIGGHCARVLREIKDVFGGQAPDPDTIRAAFLWDARVHPDRDRPRAASKAAALVLAYVKRGRPGAHGSVNKPLDLEALAREHEREAENIVMPVATRDYRGRYTGG